MAKYAPEGETCPFGGKASYKSEGRAKAAARGVSRYREMRVYQCPRCWNWHFTSQRYKSDNNWSFRKNKNKRGRYEQ